MANLWSVSIDDSGDAKKIEYVIAGCLIGNKAAWSAFHKAWRRQLHLSPRIEYFHQKECASMTGEFRQFLDKLKWPKPLGSDARSDKRSALLSVIANSNLKAYAMAVRVPEYEAVRRQSKKARRFLDKDPWAYLVQELAFDTAKTILKSDPNANVAFMAGPHEKSAQYEKFYEGFKAKNPVIAEHMLSITHGDYRKIYSLQAADLIASESKKSFESAEKKESEQAIFQRHPILGSFIAFQTIPKERLKGVIRVQGKKRKQDLV
jgi:hypothetical protein